MAKRKISKKCILRKSRKRNDIEVDKRQIGYAVLSHDGNVEEGFFSTKKEADKFAKEISKGITPQELHKCLTGKYEKTR